jgi:hypothetical protein
MHRKFVRSAVYTRDKYRILITRLLKNRSFEESNTAKERKWLRRLLRKKKIYRC